MAHFFAQYFLHHLPKEWEPSEELIGPQNQPRGHIYCCDVKKANHKG
ncbi:hypothetical protein Celaphus_00004194 [Cervus elaphus hippelaphus]|uniref:Uncharacterized protein n=1 Tax=Cervus elaphus hippelaphus TaxID=46360 RepID=A0A212DCH5_CEREH|nr:hypothetical protein Celaphus_00004194 [Cervus elaphus hippelaphus]